MNSVLIAIMAGLGATLAQIASHQLTLRRHDAERKQRTFAVINAMISDLDYCSLFLRSSYRKIQNNNGVIVSRNFDGIYQAFSKEHFQIEDLLQAGLYHRYQQPTRFAEQLSNLLIDEYEYNTSPEFIETIKHYATYATYLADALEKQKENGGGNIPDFADYDPQAIELRMSKGTITNKSPIIWPESEEANNDI